FSGDDFRVSGSFVGARLRTRTIAPCRLCHRRHAHLRIKRRTPELTRCRPDHDCAELLYGRPPGDSRREMVTRTVRRDSGTRRGLLASPWRAALRLPSSSDRRSLEVRIYAWQTPPVGRATTPPLACRCAGGVRPGVVFRWA